MEYIILQGHGYVIPSFVLSVDENNSLQNMVRSVPSIGIAKQEVYDSHRNHTFIYFIKEADILVKTYVNSSSRKFINCGEFVASNYRNDIDDCTGKSDKKRKKIDKIIKKWVPSLYGKIVAYHPNCYDKWIFGYYK